jgi:hypothetical protein
MALSMMSRPQISIDRLPPRRSANEPRELMNCKSCRKRKVRGKSTRRRLAQTDPTVRPDQVQQIKAVLRGMPSLCRSVHIRFVVPAAAVLANAADAVPKKRGPKTDVLEALLKRVDGLEKRLKPEDRRAAESLAKERAANLMKKAALDTKPAPPHLDISLAAMLPAQPSMQSTVSPAETLR